ncbi:MAG: patatin-like phospholipase family protein [Gammaproteobacteria bacterium]
MFRASSCRLGALYLACVLPVAAMHATALAAEATARPRVGLVLGGGGAKGAAHIGVLRVLEEMRIPVDCVTGTSMGALVGATFASGLPPEEIERRVLAVDWSRTVGTAGVRDQTPINAKLQGSTYTNNLDVGIRGGRLKGGGGVLKSQEIEELLRNLVANARYVDNFDSLPIPFRAVATDMLAGEMVVLGKGDLTVAMRASMAVPGAFSPVIIGDQVLADGGQMRNVPVDIARELCGEVIIAVSLATPPPKPEDLTSALALAGRSIDVMIDANGRAQLATLTDRDVSIVVPMGDIGSASFERVPDAIPLGRAAALSKSAELLRYAVPDAEYRAWQAKLRRDYEQPIRVAGVRIEGLERVNPDYVRAEVIATRPGAEVTPDVIAEDASRIYALGDFQKVEYSVVDTPVYPTVEFVATEKSWGPDFLKFDLGLGFTAGGDFSFALVGEHTRTWLNPYGGQWHSVAQLGQDLQLRTALYQPLELRQRVFIEPYVQLDRNMEDIYDDGQKIGEFSFRRAFGQVDLGYNIGTVAQLRVGVRQSWGRADLETGDSAQLSEQPTTKESNLVVQATWDTRDVVGLPSQGSLLTARYRTSGSWLDGEQSYELAEGLLLKVLPFRGDALYVFAAGGGELSGTMPPYELFAIGGINSFPGLERQQLRATGYWVSGASYNRKLGDIQKLFGQALYGGLRLTAGDVTGRIDEVDDGTIFGAALSLSGRTPVGPFLVSLGGTNNGFWELQFAFGRPIREGSILDAIW